MNKRIADNAHRLRLSEAPWQSQCAAIALLVATALLLTFLHERLSVSVSEPAHQLFSLIPLAKSLHLTSLEYGLFPSWFVGSESGISLSTFFLPLLVYLGFSAWSSSFLQASILTLSLILINLLFLGDSLSLRSLLSGSALLLFACRCPWVTLPRTPVKFFALFGTSLFLVALAGLWSPTVALFFALLLFLFARRHDEPESLGDAPLLDAKDMLGIAALAACLIFFFPHPEFPKYPTNAHVIDGNALGPSLFLHTWNIHIFDTYRAHAFLLAPSLCLGASLLLSLLFPLERPSSLRTVLLSLFLTSILLAQLFLPSDVRQLFPAETLRRLIPGLGLLFFPHGLFFFAVLAALLAFSVEKKFWPPLALACCTIIPVALFTQSSLSFDGSWSKIGAPSSVQAKHFRKKQASLPYHTQQVLFSPSWPIFRDSPTLELTRQDATQISIRRFAKGLSDMYLRNSSQALLDRTIFDGNEKTRVILSQQGSLGGIHFRFKKPITLFGIFLGLGKFPSDVPGGLRISGLPSCEALASDPDERALLASKAELLYFQDPWRGPLEWTVDGYPYHAWESRVLARFDKPQKVQCLFIQETSRGNVDWSLAEARVLVEKK